MELVALAHVGAIVGYLWALRVEPGSIRALLTGAVIGALAGSAVASLLLAFIDPLASLYWLLYAVPGSALLGAGVAGTGLAAQALGAWFARRRRR